METLQRNHIRKNRLDLIRLTDCNTSFIGYLESQYVLGDYDKATLEVIPNKMDKAAKFYDIVVERANSYDIVRGALKKTTQTGALAILDKLGNLPGLSSNAAQPLPDLESRKTKRIRYNVLSPVHLFSGRVSEIALLHEYMTSQESETSSTTPITQTASITGLGGIGKTELCRKYIELYSEYYDGNVIWIQAELEADMTRDFKIVAKDHLKISLKDVDGTEKDIKTVVDEVYNYFQGKKVLFVFDNAVCSDDDHLDTFMPIRVVTSKPAILITSRDRDWREMPSKILAIGELNEEDAMEFVKKGLKIQDNSQDNIVKELVKRLQNFPLAIQQAVSYIMGRRHLRTFKIEDYLTLFETNTKLLLCERANRRATKKYSDATYTTWKITTDLIASEFGRISITFLNMMSYFEPERIPINLFYQLGSYLKIPNEVVDSALEILVKYSMISSQPDELMLSIHRLVQNVIRINLKSENTEEKVLSYCFMIFTPDFGRDIVGHAKSVLEFSIDHPSLVKKFPIVPCNVGEVLATLYNKDCSEFCNKWYQILSTHLPEGAVEIVHFECLFARQLHKEKKYNECLEALTTVREKYKKFEGQHDFQVRRTTRFIAETLNDLERLEESLVLAEAVFNDQISIEMKNLQEIRRIAKVVFEDYLMLKNFEGALLFCERVLHFVLPDQSQSTPQERRDLLNGLSETDRADSYLKEIVDIVTKLMGLDVQWDMLGAILASFMTYLGKEKDSRQLVAVMYELSKKVHGENDENTVMYLVREAKSYIKTKEYEKAVAIFQNPKVPAFIINWDALLRKKPIDSLSVFFARSFTKNGVPEEALKLLFNLLDSCTKDNECYSTRVYVLNEIALVFLKMEALIVAKEIWIEAEELADTLGNVDATLRNAIKCNISDMCKIVNDPKFEELNAVCLFGPSLYLLQNLLSLE